VVQARSKVGLIMSEPILFYTTKGEFGCFTNYSKHPVTVPELSNKPFISSENAYQAFKFHPHRPDLVELILNSKKPSESGVIGRDPANPMRGDWDKPVSQSDLAKYESLLPNNHGVIENTKDLMMYVVLYHKFDQHPDIGKVLDGTGEREIFEDSKIDFYWGVGADGSGKNKLGQMLMLLRRKRARLRMIEFKKQTECWDDEDF